MKHCPTCGTNYDDDSLGFCLKCGVPLKPPLPNESESLPPTQILEQPQFDPRGYATTPIAVSHQGPNRPDKHKTTIADRLGRPRPLSIAGYVILAAVVVMAILVNHPPRYAATLFALAAFAVLVCDILATQSARFTALFIARRGWLAVVVLGTSLVAAIALTLAAGSGESQHGIAAVFQEAERRLLRSGVSILFQFLLQGALVGVMVRVLVWAMFARFLRGGPIEVSRLLLLVAFTVMMWLFPLGASHRVYAGLYLLGVGGGFMIHYLVRNKEHQRAQTVRIGRNISESVREAQLKAIEVDAVRYYAKQKWRELDQLLTDETEPNTVLTIINASRLRIRGDYRLAVRAIEKELGRKERDQSLDGFLYLHKALSLADLNERKEMHQALESALRCQEDCMLTRVTIGLRLAEDISPEDAIRDEKQADNSPKQKAVKYIWYALKNESSQPELITQIVGRTVPATWTFLLDAYAYVLLKAGHVRFSRALLAAAIYEDPYFSSPYLHLGEWCIADLLRARRQNPSGYATQKNSERSRRVGRLCLNIAIQLEGKRRSNTKRRAEGLLESYRNLLYGITL